MHSGVPECTYINLHFEELKCLVKTFFFCMWGTIQNNNFGTIFLSSGQEKPKLKILFTQLLARALQMKKNK